MSAQKSDVGTKTSFKVRTVVRFIPLILGITAFALALGTGGFLVYTLMLKTEYKNTAFEINESFRTEDTVTMRKGDDSVSLPVSDAAYYNTFLLNQNTVVFSRKPAETTVETIFLDFGKEVLSFTGLDDGSAIAICWKTPANEKHYIVRSNYSFMQLSAYFTNCRRKA